MGTIKTIEFIQTKSGNIAAIINGKVSIIKNNATEKFNWSDNVAVGRVNIESTEELIATFSEAYFSFLNEREEKAKKAILAYEEKEAERIATIKKEVENYICPLDLADAHSLDTVKVVEHSGKNSVAIIIDSAKYYELLQIAIEKNGWEGEWGELRQRAGEHRSTFYHRYNHEDFVKTTERILDEKYSYKDAVTEEDIVLEKLRNINSIENAKELLKKYDEMEDGYYNDNDSLVTKFCPFSFWGYEYNGVSYRFGFLIKLT